MFHCESVEMASVSKAGKIDRLNEDNYRTWKCVATIYLIQKDLWPYVNGDIEKRDATGKEARQFNSKVEKALATIALAVEADQQVHTVDCTTAAQAWNVLQQDKNNRRLFTRRRIGDEG
ncbi:uncharacterized protein LOC143378642 [Andrena cerasifolii]|uniref:uncharacterized protein LOC143378642 n=1 Tax=Andrena cerasifolii TaxID=2819439 RepID=UPI0040383380